MTGVERRRDWSDVDKFSILQEAVEPDTKIADVARRHDFKPQQITPGRGSSRRGRLSRWFLFYRSP
ncbi:transposase [Neorhizobium sp. 2083]|uniref:transposase n=1 Tax=Neorhizobium sp. 2083 TaxID=2817762 RepID=UPI00386209DC